MLLFNVSVKSGIAEVRLHATALEMATLIVIFASATMFGFGRFSHRASFPVIAVFIVGILLTVGLFGLRLLDAALKLDVVHYKLNKL